MYTTRAGWHLLCAALLSACLLLPVAAAVGLPEDLDSKPLIDQLLARKAFLAQHMQSAEWKQHIQQQLDARNGPHKEQGVLIVAGGRDMFANAAITLSVLRGHLRSSIPMEIVHYGSKELPPKEILEFIAAYNSSGDSTNSSAAQGVLGPVFITDALAVAPPEQAAALHRKLPEGIKSFPAKVYALTHVTRFKQVLLLDADSMPLVDPGLLFKVPAFRRTGSMFWPDLWWNAWVNDTIYTLVGDMKQAPWVGNPHHRLVDSGQILFDRARHPEVLEYMWLLNSHHEWVYKHMHGDKDTFLLAFSMAGKRDMFNQVPCFARDAMRHMPKHWHKYHHLGMVQSIPPVMLAAAMRAAALDAGGDSSSSSSSGGSDGTAGAAGTRRLTSRASTHSGDTAAVWSASSNTQHSSSDGSGREPVTLHSSGHLTGSSNTGVSGSPVSAAIAGHRQQQRHHVSATTGMHATPSSSSSSSGLQQQQWRDWVARRLLLQAGGRGWSLLQSAAAAGGAGDTSAAAGSAGDTSAGDAAASQQAPVDSVGMEDPEADEGLRHAGSGDGDGDGDDASGADDDTGKAASTAQGPPVTAAAAAAPTPAPAPAPAAGPPPAEVGPQLPAKRARLQYVGVPVFFHRTSFNSKFFPDCLKADKITTHYCEVEWVSVPLSSEQAGHSLKPNMYAWDKRNIDPDFFTEHCGSNASHITGSGHHSRATPSGRHLADWQSTHSSSSSSSSSSPRHLQQYPTAAAAGGARRTHRKRRRPVVETYGLPPEHSCEKLPIGENVMPIPIMRIGMFPYFEKVLKASYEAFDIVRRVAGIGF